MNDAKKKICEDEGPAVLVPVLIVVMCCSADCARAVPRLINRQEAQSSKTKQMKNGRLSVVTTIFPPV